jgi:hypothetical protein
VSEFPPVPAPGVPFAVPGEALEGLEALTPAIGRGPRTLLLADEPERIPGPGLMYRDTVSGPFRAYLYALADAAAPLTFEVLLRNPGPSPVTVRVQRAGLAGPGAGFFQVGQAALAAWLAASRPLRPAVLAPGHSAPLWPPLAGRRVPRGQVINAIIDAEASGPVEVSFLAGPLGRAVPAPLPPGARPAALPMRGTFPAADLTLAVSANGRQRLRLGAPTSYLVGYSALDQRPVVNYGNYGVRYDLLFRGGASGGQASLVFVPTGGGFCGVAAVGGRQLPLSAPGGRQLDVRQAISLGRHPLPPPGAAPLQLTWMPPAASYLPAALVLA